MAFAKKRGALMMALASVSLLGGCGDKPVDPEKQARAALPHAPGKFYCKDGAITLGLVRAESGGFSFFDMTGARGADIAFDQINREGGIDGCPIELLRGDTQSDPALARQVAEDLLREGAKIIVTPGDFDMGVGASQAAQEAGVLSISFEASASDWSKAIGPHHFTAAITELDQGKAMAQFAAKRGWGGAYIVTNDAFNVFTATEKAFVNAYPGKIVAQDRVADDASDYSAVITKIRAAGPAVGFIFLNDYFPHVGTFLRQLRAAGVDLPVIGNQNFSTPALPPAAGKAAVANVFYVAQGFYEAPSASEEANAFTKAYREKYDVFPENANALAGYEGAIVLLKALKQAETTDAAELAATISSQRDLTLPTSTIYSWDNRHPRRSVSVISFDADGKPELVDLLDPREPVVMRPGA